MIKKILIILLLIINQSFADNNSIEQLTKLLNNLSIIYAHFTQIVSNKHGVTLQEQTGIMQIKKPNLLNWRVLTPDQMLIITDGNKIWNYDIDLNQVIVKNFNSSIADNKISGLLLGDVNKILNNYIVNKLENNNSNLSCFELNNKNSNHEDSFVKAQLCFNNKQQLTMVKLYDQLDQETEFMFSKIKSRVEPNAFKFIMPENVDILEDY